MDVLDAMIKFDELEAAMAARNVVKHESYKKSTNAYIVEMEKINKMIEFEIVQICKSIAEQC